MGQYFWHKIANSSLIRLKTIRNEMKNGDPHQRHSLHSAMISGSRSAVTVQCFRD